MGDRYYQQQAGKIKKQEASTPSGGLRLIRQIHGTDPSKKPAPASKELKADIAKDIQNKLNTEIPSLANMTKPGLLILRSCIG